MHGKIAIREFPMRHRYMGATPIVKRTGGRFIATGERIVDKATTGTHRRSRERMSLMLKSSKTPKSGLIKVI